MFIKGFKLLFHPEGMGNNAPPPSLPTPGDAKDERSILDAEDKKVKDDKVEEEEEIEEEETDEEQEEEEEDEDKKGKSEDEDEESGEEDEEESDAEGDDEEETLESDTVYQSLKKIDKGIFKKVPELRSVIFREQKFTEIFPSVEDAEKAAEAASILTQYERDLMGGKADVIFKALEGNKKSLETFAANLLPALFEANKELHTQVLAPEFKKALRAAAKSGNKALEQSATNIHWFLFGHTDLSKEEGISVSSKKSDKEEEIEKKEREFERKQYESFAKDVAGTAKSKAMRHIAKRFEELDMSDLMKKHLSNEIWTRMTQSLDKDVRYNGQMANLWKKAATDGYTTEGKERIINTFLSRAKVLIPKFSQTVLSEAKLSASSKNGKKRPKRIPSGSSSSGTPSGKFDPKKVDWSKTSELDILSGKTPVSRS